MSPVALTLNLTLGVLLVGAMILGLRLDRRLRALRESHLSFAKAVSELDQAALRTQSGLEELRATAESVRSDLAARIDSARTLSDILIKLTADADAKAEALAKAQAAAPPPLRTSSARPALARPAIHEIKPAASPRSRAAVDDELFESAGSALGKAALSAVGGGRR
ncbi:MAG TPA: DUF6468 domain-containing protein [Caulobacteraceae bacterium]|nr:DUF6468 domain-containing protein [Caulobacteraceae bacterium]